MIAPDNVGRMFVGGFFFGGLFPPCLFASFGEWERNNEGFWDSGGRNTMGMGGGGTRNKFFNRSTTILVTFFVPLHLDNVQDCNIFRHFLRVYVPIL